MNQAGSPHHSPVDNAGIRRYNTEDDLAMDYSGYVMERPASPTSPVHIPSRKSRAPRVPPPKPPRTGRIFRAEFHLPQESNLQHLGVIVGLEERQEVRDRRDFFQESQEGEDDQEEYYVAVTGFVAGSLAAESGRLKASDEIIEINGIKTKDMNDGQVR